MAYITAALFAMLRVVPRVHGRSTGRVIGLFGLNQHWGWSELRGKPIPSTILLTQLATKDDKYMDEDEGEISINYTQSRSFFVQIFNPLEYPDIPSGGVSEKLVEVGTEAFIRIDSVTFMTTDESRRFSAETRSCIFANELPAEFGQNYKRSDCVVSCRILSIYSLCNCIPFFVPVMQRRNGLIDLESVDKCALHHLSCLIHYRAKWAKVLLNLEKSPGLEKDVEDGLYCPQCLASCSETIYNVKTTALPLLKPPKNTNTIL
ncbi:Sodium channel protein Nach [Pseudolycoriella hygida]|uniref:Sodium channel protein Nach n=1 Tax=Pseudolycoriella hygida TaxID=35572 RepID=A0A9Q0MXT5_9DIPT|nr:Sodium channel protein Nach [Pseudolycoriella hygida]